MQQELMHHNLLKIIKVYVVVTSHQLIWNNWNSLLFNSNFFYKFNKFQWWFRAHKHVLAEKSGILTGYNIGYTIITTKRCWHEVLTKGADVFEDLQKAFDTVDHQMLLVKLNHYGICGVSNDWFKSCLIAISMYL